MTSGIYKIENKKTGQVYIGQSKNIEQRFSVHCSVQNVDVAIALEGVENFIFTIVEETDNLLSREKYWIDQYNATCDGNYNRVPGEHWRRYTLWDIHMCKYSKGDMHKNNKNLNPRRCFKVKYNKQIINIGGFHDFLSCEIISELINSFINN